jgi:hypothetical protein
LAHRSGSRGPDRHLPPNVGGTRDDRKDPYQKIRGVPPLAGVLS